MSVLQIFSYEVRIASSIGNPFLTIDCYSNITWLSRSLMSHLKQATKFSTTYSLPVRLRAILGLSLSTKFARADLDQPYFERRRLLLFFSFLFPFLRSPTQPAWLCLIHAE